MLKKSTMVMLRPSQIFLMVDTVALLLRPLTILFSVDWVTPLMVASLFIVMLFSLHSSIILFFVASPIFNGFIPFMNDFGVVQIHNNHFGLKRLTLLG